MTINPLQPSEIRAYFDLIGEDPTPWEVRTLLRMDQAFLERIQKKPKHKKGLEIPAEDTEGVSSLLRGLKGRKKGSKGMTKIDPLKDTG